MASHGCEQERCSTVAISRVGIHAGGQEQFDDSGFTERCAFGKGIDIQWNISLGDLLAGTLLDLTERKAGN